MPPTFHKQTRWLSRIGTIVTLLSVMNGCITTGPESGGGSLAALNVISTEQEIQLGQQVSAQVEKDSKILADPEIQAYVNGIGQRLARVSPRQDIQYTFKVIDDPQQVNAFALPGGNMYIYTSLMRLCTNEAELAAVMAHEMGHVAQHHHGKSLTRQYGYEMLTNMLLGQTPGQGAQVAAGLIGKAVSSRFSQQEENEADAMGMDLLFAAGYEPNALITFMNKMLAEEQKAGGNTWLPIFASHPPTSDRLQNLNALLTKYPLNLRQRSQINAEQYREKVLKRLPTPPPPAK